ncbi:hypothetical protein [Candidatus Phytoplasma meliae]|uniref:Ribosomal protein L29 n=1 Tax=Candidatus Phytoplasma meliae TaxID=1848402 RepID=A0ABS5CYZ8_9MOLU|nr:hypothetical protein [Candidatus Phytoplasma meliae]MBP5835786.1 hypothetical protein [Candidatus Phytoplasma meliae]MBP5836203.1 hypothetical protein [Candidatus Phytoplasma meliae]
MKTTKQKLTEKELLFEINTLSEIVILINQRKKLTQKQETSKQQLNKVECLIEQTTIKEKIKATNIEKLKIQSRIIKKIFKLKNQDFIQKYLKKMEH